MGGKEKDTVAETLDHVVAKRTIRNDHRHQCARGRHVASPITIDHERHRLTAYWVRRLDADLIADDARNEERVQSAPSVGGVADGYETVLRLQFVDCVAPEADHSSHVVPEDAGPRVQSLVHALQ